MYFNYYSFPLRGGDVFFALRNGTIYECFFSSPFYWLRVEFLANFDDRRKFFIVVRDLKIKLDAKKLPLGRVGKELRRFIVFYFIFREMIFFPVFLVSPFRKIKFLFLFGSRCIVLACYTFSRRFSFSFLYDLFPVGCSRNSSALGFFLFVFIFFRIFNLNSLRRWNFLAVFANTCWTWHYWERDGKLIGRIVGCMRWKMGTFGNFRPLLSWRG